MIKVAICGNIASGKSTVQNILENLDYKVLDTDKVSHELLNVKNTQLYNTFKSYDVFENGEFSRKKMGDLIFKDEYLKKKLEIILHPQIADKIREFFDSNISQDMVFVGIPLLFEAKMESLFDKIVFIYADDDIRLDRLLERNGYDLEYAQMRISCQIPQEEKVKKSDCIIYNNDNKESLKISVMRTLKFLQE